MKECLHPWSEPGLIQSYTAQYLLIGQCYQIFKRWKLHHGLLFDRKVLKPNLEIRERLNQFQTEAIVPIPQEFSRSWDLRGSRALRIAECLSPQTRLPVLPILLASPKSPTRKRQAELSMRERLANPIRFEINEALLRTRPMPTRLILVDDFLTTGHTVRQAARALKSRGVQSIHIFCLGLRPALNRR